jgi:hypothetical protein
VRVDKKGTYSGEASIDTGPLASVMKGSGKVTAKDWEKEELD